MKKYIPLFLIVFITSAFADPHYNIGIIIDNKSTETELLLIKLQNQIRAVVGEDAQIDFPSESLLVNNYNLELAKQNYQKLLDNETDIIISFGIINNEVVSHQKIHKKPTILFGALNQDFNELDMTKQTSGIKNYTYLVESESYKEDLKKLKQLTHFKNIGIVIDAAVVDFLPLKQTFDAVLKDIDAEYKIIPFKTIDDITENLAGLDAIYIAGGFFLKQAEVRQLANILIEKKLPSFTINGISQVKNGIMASHQAEGDIDQFFRRISLTIEGYISGTPLAQMPVFIDYTTQLTINYNTVQAIGVPIRYSLINDTDFVGDFNNINYKMKYNLTSIVNQVLNRNLNLESNRLDVRLSEQNLRMAKSNYLPNVTVATSAMYIDPDLAAISNGTNPEFSTSANITLKQTLYSDAANAGIDIQRSLQKAQVEQFNTEELNTIFEAINAYFTILILKTNTQIQLQNLKLTKNNLKLANQSYEVGQSGKSDTLRFRSAKAQNTQAMVEVAKSILLHSRAAEAEEHCMFIKDIIN
ncbi:MAG: TolC family protein, partial [Alcanivoracaceae bacterium]|nr:TolC family protein [Alcanivoracaceae bacterium]